VAKTSAGREKEMTDQFFITPTAETMPQQFINVGSVPAKPEDSAPTGQPPLSEIAYVDIGESKPVILRPSPQLRDTLGVRTCCGRRECVPGKKGTCNILDPFFDARRASRPLSAGQQEWRSHQSSKALKRQRKADQRQSEEQHVRQQASVEPMRCKGWELGRCARNHPSLHGEPEETMIIVCCSKRGVEDEGYDELFRTCPFARYPNMPCPYMGHEED
jgi:hypothetical protein